ncbi:hypothetical protein DUF4180 [[Clostridium] sordellii]|uniref:DUF4180 domain-containing protein n=1 Tax=Paraclostridium sordellii TaxID=1505 RepID=UPI0005E93CD1|nr:DUF4180 domain-containing protein [Paeniclostridium sordellii]MCR1848864.1 DUF4180 domain-containing protein [Paeniclostridium sordellii]CEN74586.1 hypothetical protein DUF4180 [[Clostridium] sordellii] [Paeniclostridium sordellii]
MKYKIIEKSNKRYIELVQRITCETDVFDIISICISNDINSILIREEVLKEEFINLKTGLAGIVLQKFIDYKIKASAIIEDKNSIKGRFKELMHELDKNNDFRVFNNITDAENWIINTKEN